MIDESDSTEEDDREEDKGKDDLQKPAELQELGQTVSIPAAYTALLNRLSEYTAELIDAHSTKICKLACLTLLFS